MNGQDELRKQLDERMAELRDEQENASDLLETRYYEGAVDELQRIQRMVDRNE